MTMFNKEINKFKIALTSDCPLRCTHCFIDKDLKEKINFPMADSALDLFINSKGTKKILEIYGGEPFLEFELLKEVVALAQKKALKKKKELSISIASNGVLILSEHLEYMIENDIRLSISLSGTKETHDLIRKFPGGSGSYLIIKKKLPNILAKLGEKLHIIFCVHPLRSSFVYQDFKALVAMGIKNIGIECVHGFEWTESDYNDFSKGMEKINSYVIKKVQMGDFILLEPFMEAFREKTYENDFCPFLRDLEIFPDGTLSLYPYPFVKDLAQRKKISVGTALKGIKKKYSSCQAKAGSSKCNNCLANYYHLPGLYEGSLAYKMRTDISIKAVRDMLTMSKKDKALRVYLKTLVKLFKKGYT
jgi:sulfatase maturation enzyme AslB (radical SAM superfamily)